MGLPCDSTIEKEQAKTLNALQSVLDSTEQLSVDVEAHQDNLQSVNRNVTDIAAGSAYEEAKEALLGEIATALEASRRLEQDLVCTQYELEEQAQELDRQRREAMRDELSGVGNRRAFDEALRFMMTNFRRRKRPFALLMIDIDHFKWINDTHGHLAGDEVVRRLGQTLQRAVRPTDRVARYGGDEFGVFLSGADLSTGVETAQRIRRQIDSTNFDVGDNAGRLAVTLSMGLAVVEGDDSGSSLIKRADEALYESKQAGRNRLTVRTVETETLDAH